MPSKIGTSSSHWFARGLMGGFLLMAGINGLSFFYRSGGFGSLLGYDPLPNESMGFPWKIWNETKTYGGFMVDYGAMGLNVLFAMLPGVIFGMLGIWYRDSFNQRIGEFEHQEANANQLSFQFSTQTLLVITAVVAVAIAALSTWRESRITLAAIYLLGPAAIIAIAMLPNNIRWIWRAALLVISAVVTIGLGIAIGLTLGMDFEKVMFGIFVCWVPQSVFAALLHTIWLIVDSCRNPPNPSTT